VRAAVAPDEVQSMNATANEVMGKINDLARRFDALRDSL